MTAPTVVLHPHDFPNGNKHRHSHAFTEDHPAPVNEAHPQPYYFLCADCEPHRAEHAAARASHAIMGEWSDTEPSG